MPPIASKKILIVPLDWGLGHTTRCIPIIRSLLQLHHEVHIGGTPITNGLLKEEFPDIVYHTFPSYNISYPRNGRQFLRHIVIQLPRIALVINKEKRITAQVQKKYQFDLIISDNRFGVRHPSSNNIFISHQLNLSIPQAAWMERIANRLNRYYINKFNRVGVPDWEQHILSGTLSKTDGIKSGLIFLGNLSRWENTKQEDVEDRILVVLSGPEPQRTMLEDIIKEQSHTVALPIIVVRAKPQDQQVIEHKGITFFNHLASDDLEELVKKSSIVISRAGYSTIMDLVAIRKQGILIPTPGQTEQEYLVKHLEDSGLFNFYLQEDFKLSLAISAFQQTTWGGFPTKKISLSDRLEKLIS